MTFLWKMKNRTRISWLFLVIWYFQAFICGYLAFKTNFCKILISVIVFFCQKKILSGYHLQPISKNSEEFSEAKLFEFSVVGGCWDTWFCNFFSLLRTNRVSMKNRLYLVLTPGWVVLLQIMILKTFSTFNWLVLVKNWWCFRRRLKRILMVLKIEYAVLIVICFN